MFWNKKKDETEDSPPKKEVITCWESEQKTAEELAKENEKFQKYMELTKDLPKSVPMIGYKAVNADYEAFFGNQKYEIGETYTESQPIIPCERGFHFCRTLEDTMKLFPPEQGTRYLRVEGEVPVTYYVNADDQAKTQYQNCADLLYAKSIKKYNECGYWYSPVTGDMCSFKPARGAFYNSGFKTKYVTNKLTILEEIPFEVYAEKALNELVETEDEYYSTIGTGLYSLARTKWLAHSKNYFSVAFAGYVFKKYLVKTSGSGKTTEQYVKWYNGLIEALNAVKDEDVSQDMRILLFLTNLNLM